MLKKTLQIAVALGLGGLFLWLAFRNVSVEAVWKYAQNISYGWILPLTLASLASHILRAERWRLLIEHDKEEVDRITLVSGVLVGYLMNVVGPRLGEVSRPVYVARREQLRSSKLMGTIVLERIVDFATMCFLMLVVSIYLISDTSLLVQIFGQETIDFFTGGFTFSVSLWIIGLLAAVTLMAFLFVKAFIALGRRIEKVQYWIDRIKEALHLFKDGLLSARKVKKWWLFLFYTVLLWCAYTLMTYIPFWMFDMQDVYHLNMLDAVVITVISAIGIAIPSPGGIGTYHYLVKQSLLVLFSVPAVTGLAYATITHASMIIIVCFFTPVFLFIDKLRAARAGSPVL